MSVVSLLFAFMNDSVFVPQTYRLFGLSIKTIHKVYEMLCYVFSTSLTDGMKQLETDTVSVTGKMPVSGSASFHGLSHMSV